jgi:hypothetical protein
MFYDFEDNLIMWPDTYYCEIDTSNVNNIWQIGEPHKQYFDSAFSVPNAIVTDLNNSYPPNNHSSFQFLFKKPVWYLNWFQMHLEFIHKFDTDSLYDGGYVEISYNGGQTWVNIIDDNCPDLIETAPFYSSNDTIVGGIPAFTGRSDDWQTASINFLWNYENSFTVDSCIIRFNFISDSIDNSKEGWIIDGIGFQVHYFLDEITEHNNIKEISLFPDPVDETSIIKIINWNQEKYILNIYNTLGILLFHEVISNDYVNIGEYRFGKGLYYYELINDKRKYSGRFVVQ